MGDKGEDDNGERAKVGLRGESLVKGATVEDMFSSSLGVSKSVGVDGE